MPRTASPTKPLELLTPLDEELLELLDRPDEELVDEELLLEEELDDELLEDDELELLDDEPVGSSVEPPHPASPMLKTSAKDPAANAAFIFILLSRSLLFWRLARNKPCPM